MSGKQGKQKSGSSCMKCLFRDRKGARQGEAAAVPSQPADRFTTFGTWVEEPRGRGYYEPGPEELLPENWGSEPSAQKKKSGFCKLMKMSRMKSLFKDSVKIPPKD